MRACYAILPFLFSMAAISPSGLGSLPIDFLDNFDSLHNSRVEVLRGFRSMRIFTSSPKSALNMDRSATLWRYSIQSSRWVDFKCFCRQLGSILRTMEATFQFRPL